MTKYDPLYMAAWREKNREKTRAYMKKWMADHHEEMLIYHKAYRAQHRDKLNAQPRDSYDKSNFSRRANARKNYEKSRDLFVEKMRGRVAKSPSYYLWKRAWERAKTKGLEFTILPDDIVVPEKCPVLGIVLVRGRGRFCPTSPTVDRADNSRGYTPDNIVVISWRANRLKSDSTPGELRAIADFYEARK